MVLQCFLITIPRFYYTISYFLDKYHGFRVFSHHNTMFLLHTIIVLGQIPGFLHMHHGSFTVFFGVPCKYHGTHIW